MITRARIAELLSAILGVDIERVLIIPKKSVISGNTKSIDSLVVQAVQDLRRIHDLYLWDITISGYKSDLRHLAEITEVRDWCAKVHTKTPYILFLMRNPSWYLLCILHAKSIGKETRLRNTMFWIESRILEKSMLEVTDWLSQFAADYQLSSSEIKIVMEKGFAPVMKILHDLAAQQSKANHISVEGYS
ncbi:MAG: hypothetical protein PHO26_04090 [Dehalococcoidia bacterium]|nr:hypothetical protein [Dehalococcoidia bacterium]